MANITICQFAAGWANNLLLFMLILTCCYHRVLSNDNYLKSFADGLLTIFLDNNPDCRVLALSVENSIGFTHPAISGWTVKVSGLLPFRKLREKRRIRQMISAEKPGLVISLNENVAPRGCSEIVLVTHPVTHTIVADTHRVLVLSDYASWQLHAGAIPVQKLSPRPGVFCKPVSWDRREYIKQSYAKGWEYFFCAAFNTSVEQLTVVLKAFSLFKKWQNSNVKLLISETAGISERVEKLLEHYKYRADVVLLDDNDPDGEADAVAASFAVIYMPADDPTGLRVLNYLQAETPVITCEAGAIREMAGDAALYCDKNSIEDIAGKMKLIYKDERLRTQAINKGKVSLQQKLNEPGLVDAASAFL